MAPIAFNVPPSVRENAAAANEEAVPMEEVLESGWINVKDGGEETGVLTAEKSFNNFFFHEEPNAEALRELAETALDF